MNRSEQINELAAALAKAQGAIEGAKKDSVNPHFKSAYADLASVWEAVRGPLTSNGLAITQWLRTAENGVEVETVLMHVSGQYMSDVLWMPVLKMDPHSVGSASSYGRRYALMAALGVAPIDDDGNAATEAHKPGVPGSAAGGTDFRPAGYRRMPTSNWVDDAMNDGIVDQGRNKGALPPKPANGNGNGNANKLVERAKKAIAYFKDSATTSEAAKAYWSEREDPIAEIEAALPAEYERMLDAYNQCLERHRGRL